MLRSLQLVIIISSVILYPNSSRCSANGVALYPLTSKKSPPILTPSESNVVSKKPDRATTRPSRTPSLNTSLEFTEALQRRFRDCFRRRETWERFLLCLHDRLHDSERTAPDAALPEGTGAVRSRQRFLSDSVWDAEKVMARYHEGIRDVLGDRDGALVFQTVDFVKKGSDSAGVARQPCGPTGRLRNAQVGVFAVYVSRHGAALVDGRLFAPAQWFGEDSRDKRRKRRFPEAIEYQTKTEIALGMLERMQAAGTLPFRYVLTGRLDDTPHDFILAIEKNPHCFYFLTIPEDATISYNEKISWKRRSKKGWLWYWKKQYVGVVKKRRASMRAWSCIRRIPPGSWRRRVVTGCLEERGDEFTRRRLPVSIGARPDRQRWLIGRRIGGKRPAYTYYISNAPARERLAAFVRLSGVVEEASHCLREATIGAGLNRYAVRSWTGWHRHTLACMVAHFFRSGRLPGGADQVPG
jgi:SRSO17 transposase